MIGYAKIVDIQFMVAILMTKSELPCPEGRGLSAMIRATVD